MRIKITLLLIALASGLFYSCNKPSNELESKVTDGVFVTSETMDKILATANKLPMRIKRLEIVTMYGPPTYDQMVGSKMADPKTGQLKYSYRTLDYIPKKSEKYNYPEGGYPTIQFCFGNNDELFRIISSHPSINSRGETLKQYIERNK